MPQQVDNRIDFRYGTRQRRRKLDSRAFSAGADITPMRINKVGYLTRIWLHLYGTVDSSGAIVAAKDTPYSLIKRVKLNLNSGNSNIVDISGFGLFALNHFIASGFAPNDGGGGGNGVTDSDNYFHDLNNADETNNFSHWFEIPIAANAGEQFSAGALMMQAPELEAFLEVTFGSNSEYGTNITAIAGTLDVYIETYDVPNPQLVRLPPPTVHRLIEERYPINAVGENKFDLKRQGVLLQLLAITELNGSRNHVDIDRLELRLNETEELYKTDTELIRFLQRRNNGVGFPTGVLSFDFWHAHELVSMGDQRDSIDMEAIALTTLNVEVNSAATLGANNNQVRIIRRILQNLR
jgi:hypothetical protein